MHWRGGQVAMYIWFSPQPPDHSPPKLCKIVLSLNINTCKFHCASNCFNGRWLLMLWHLPYGSLDAEQKPQSLGQPQILELISYNFNSFIIEWPAVVIMWSANYHLDNVSGLFMSAYAHSELDVVSNINHQSGQKSSQSKPGLRLQF